MSIKHILITGRLYAELENILTNRIDAELRFLPEAEITPEQLAWADAYAGFRPVPGFRSDRFAWVHAFGAGVDAFIHHQAWNPGTPLTRTTGAFGRKIAEYSLSHILADAQYHDHFNRLQVEKRWVPATPKALSGQRAVIFGTGTIGQEVAHTLSAVGLHVSGISMSGGEKPFFADAYTLDRSSEILSTADWVINTMPLTIQTEQLLNRQMFSAMSGCGFINVGRGASVNHDDLIQALDAKQVRLAVLDVFETEPLPENSPLWHREDVCVTPHISAVTSVEEAAEAFVQAWEAIRTGSGTIPNLVNVARGY